MDCSQRWSSVRLAFITAQEVLTDPIYSAPGRYAGPKGLSQIERVTGGRWRMACVLGLSILTYFWRTHFEVPSYDAKGRIAEARGGTFQLIF